MIDQLLHFSDSFYFLPDLRLSILLDPAQSGANFPANRYYAPVFS